MSDAPRRIQRSRAKGWKMPANTVYVGRPTRWGNPFRVGVHGTAQECVDLFARWIAFGCTRLDEAAEEHLRGKNLACFCALDQPCHADVLLELANAPLRCEAADA